jgi:hypothetical protein
MEVFAMKTPKLLSTRLLWLSLCVTLFGCLGAAQNAVERSEQDPEKAFYRMTDMATAEYAKGNFAGAASVADQLLKAAPLWEKNWNYGNAVHAANIVLGRLALRKGETDRAKEFLIAAGKTPGSPQLDTFGPDMILAKELLKKGETQAVLDYFDLCAKFWKMENGKLAAWRAAIRADETPDFGPNLRYFANWGCRTLSVSFPTRTASFDRRPFPR